MPVFILAGTVLFRNKYGVCSGSERTEKLEQLCVIKVVGSKQKPVTTKQRGKTSKLVLCGKVSPSEPH